MRYEFTLQLIGYSQITDEIEDDVFSSGCDDALLNSIDNKVYLDFSKEAESYQEAVNSAKSVLNSAGYEVVLIDEKNQGMMSATH